MSKHYQIIDEFDLKKIIKKSIEIGKIVEWLEKLKTLDSTINVKDVDSAIKHLKTKQKTLNTKAKQAQDDMIMEAEALATAYEYGNKDN